MATQDISQLVVEVKSKGIQTAANQLDKLAEKADKAEKAVKKLGTSVVGTEAHLKGGVAQTAALIGAMTTLTAVLSRMEGQTTRATRVTRQHNESMREAHALARGLSGSLGALWMTYGNVLGMGAGVTLGFALKGVVSVGKDVEHTLEQIRVLGGATTEEVAKMSATVAELGQGAQGPRDVAEALQVLTLAGLKANEAMQGVGAALNLAVAGSVSVEKASSTLVQVSTALGYAANDFDHIADVVTKTAAASMSSVESISGAFKSAAAVGEVYGATLKDIGVGLAAVANLGIQGTAAGTALKNFYKDLSGGSERVANTLKAMKVNMSDLKTADGNFKPLVEVVEVLEQGLRRVNDRNAALNNLQGERGIKVAAALIKMRNTASTELDALGNKYANKLAEMEDAIAKSAAFSTLAAIAMSQTTTNQLKGVANTLQTTFAKAFTDVAPQIGEVSRALKKAFASPEFAAGLRTLITAVADLTKFVVDHTQAIGLMIAAYAGFKVAAFATGLVAVAQGFKLASIAAAGFTATLGPIAVAIAAMGTAWLVFKANQDAALNNNTAAANLGEYADNVLKAAEKEQEALRMRKKGMSEQDVARAQQLQSDKDAAEAAIKNSEKGLAAMKKEREELKANMSAHEKFKLGLVERGYQVEGVNGVVAKYLELSNKVTQAETLHANQVHIVRAATERLIEARKENGRLADEAAAKAKERVQGDIVLGGGDDTPKTYEAAIAKYSADIESAYAMAKNLRKRAESEYRAGTIGSLEMVNKIAKAEADAYDKVSVAIAAQISLANQSAKTKADAARFAGDATQAQMRAEQALEMQTLRTVEVENAAKAAALRAEIKGHELRGEFAKAAELKWSAENKQAYADALKNAEKYGGVFKAVVQEMEDTKAAAVFAGALKEAVTSFDTQAIRTANTLKGFKAIIAGESVSGVWDAAKDASAAYKAELAELEKEYWKVAFAAWSGDAAAAQAAEEAMNRIKGLQDQHRKMWTETGETIAKSLETAFGRGGEAAGQMFKLQAAWNSKDKHSQEERMSYYGKMAGAAKGFFSEKSKGYKTLEGIEKVMHVASMARTIAQTAASLAAGAAMFFAQSGWGGFAGVAAMGAVMAGLGYVVGGGANRNNGGKSAEEVQKTQGTGVFGDAEAKSESITNSIENLENNSNMLLPLTQGMLSSLKNIEASMSGLANLVTRGGLTDGAGNFNIQEGTLKRGFGGLMGTAAGWLISPVAKLFEKVWGKTTQKVVDSGIKFGGSVDALQAGMGYSQYASVDTTKSSWFGMKKTTSNNVQTQGLNAELSKQFGLIFTGLEDTLKLAAGNLGKTGAEVGNTISNLVIESTTLSLQGLKGEELTAAINSVISKTMDQIAEAAFPEMGDFRQVGEGYAQTVVRVSSGIEQANVALKEFGITAINYRDIANKTGDVAVGIIQQSIALKEGASGVGEVMKTLTGSASDLVSAYRELTSARKQMMDMGLGNGLSRATIEAAGGLDKLSNSLDVYYDKFFTQQERTVIETRNLTASFATIGKTLPDSRAQLRSWIEAAAAAGDQTTVGSLLALAGAFDKLMTAAGKSADPLADAISVVEQALKRLSETIQAEKAALTESYKAGKEALKGRHETRLKAIKAEEAAALEAQKAAYLDLQMRVAVLRGNLEAQAEANKLQQEGLKEYVKNIESVMGALEQGIKATVPFVSKVEAHAKAMATVQSALSVARAGGQFASMTGLEDAIKALSSPSDEMYSTFVDFQRGQALTNNALTALQVEGESQLSEAQKQLEALEAAREAIEAQTSALDTALKETNSAQIEAIKAETERLEELENARYEREQERLEERYNREMEKLDAQLDLANDQLEALKGIDTRLLTLTEAQMQFSSAVMSAMQLGGGGGGGSVPMPTASPITGGASSSQIQALYQTMLGRKGDAAGVAWWEAQAAKGVSVNEIAKAIAGSAEYQHTRLPGFAVGTNEVPEDMVARIHKGERIIPAADNVALMKRLDKAEEAENKAGSDSELKAVMEKLVEVVMAGDAANVQRTNDLYKVVRDWNANGMPPERVDA